MDKNGTVRTSLEVKSIVTNHNDHVISQDTKGNTKSFTAVNTPFGIK